MNASQCSESLRPILALFSLAGQQLADYVDAIISVCGWMDGYRFDKVCKEILSEVGIQKPRPAQFIAVYRRLELAGTWPMVEHKCQDCGGTGFHPITVIVPERLAIGENFAREAVEPCRCNPVRLKAKPNEPGNPNVTKIDAPAAGSPIEAHLIRQSMRDPHYESKVRAGWRKIGFHRPDDKPIADGAAEMLRTDPKALKFERLFKNVSEKRETETEMVQRRDKMVRDAQRAANDLP